MPSHTTDGGVMAYWFDGNPPPGKHKFVPWEVPSRPGTRGGGENENFTLHLNSSTSGLPLLFFSRGWPCLEGRPWRGGY